MGLKIDFKRAVGILFGLAIMVEGIALAIYARPATIDGIGTIMGRTVMLVGMQLALLGLGVVLTWGLMEWSKVPRQGLVHKVLVVLATICPLAVAAEGLIVTMNTRQVVFQDGYSFGGVATVLLSAQLLVLGIMASMLWFVRHTRRSNPIAWLAGVFSSAIILAWGAVIMGCAKGMTIEGIGYILPRTMTWGGAILFLLGVIPLLVWLLPGTSLFRKRIERWLNVLISICLVVVFGAAVAVGLNSGTFAIPDFSFQGSAIWLALWAAQLCSLSVLALVSWFSKDHNLDRTFMPEIVGVAAGILVVFLGAAVLSMAGEAEVEGLGTLSSSLVNLIGGQILLLGLVVSSAWLLKDLHWFREGFRKSLLDIFLLVIQFILVVDGMVGMVIAAPVILDSIGTIMEDTVHLLGFALAVLGLSALLVWMFRENGPSARMLRLEFLVFLFLLLLVPAAFVITIA